MCVNPAAVETGARQWPKRLSTGPRPSRSARWTMLDHLILSQLRLAKIRPCRLIAREAALNKRRRTRLLSRLDVTTRSGRPRSKRGRRQKPKREELCDEDEFRTDRADSESIRCPGHSRRTSGDAATRAAVRWSHLLPRQRRPQYRRTRRGGAERPPAGRRGESRQLDR